MNENLFEKRISNLENEFSKINKPIKSHTPYVWILLLITALSIAFFTLFILLNHFFGFGISGDSIVLTFVGIVATFIVISNYMQVKEIENKFEIKANEVKNEFDKKNLLLEDKHNEMLLKSEKKMSDIILFTKFLEDIENKQYEYAFVGIMFLIKDINNEKNYNYEGDILPLIETLNEIIDKIENENYKLELTTDAINIYIKILHKIDVNNNTDKLTNFLYKLK